VTSRAHARIVLVSSLRDLQRLNGGAAGVLARRDWRDAPPSTD